MAKKIKINIIDRYKFGCVATIMATMVACQLHRVGGKFIPIEIPKEMWTIVTAMITHTFITVSKMKLEEMATTHVRGIVAIVLLVTVGICTYFSINLGKEWWSILGVVTAFLYGNNSKEGGVD